MKKVYIILGSITLLILIFIFQYGCKKDPAPITPPSDQLLEKTQVIGKSGGNIEVQGLTVMFDPETFDMGTSITITKDSNVPVAPSSDEAIFDRGNVYKISANVDSLRKSVKISISYSTDIIPRGYTEQNLGVIHFQQNGYEFIPGVIDNINKRILFETSSFSSFSAGVLKHKVEFPTSFTELNKTISFDNITVPSSQIQSYDYSSGYNAYYHHDNQFWGILKAPSSIDPQNQHNNVVYAVRFENDKTNTSMSFKKKVESCLVFRLDLRKTNAASMEFDYNCKSGNGYGTNGMFFVELSNDKFIPLLTNSSLSWYRLAEETNKYDRFWGDGNWHHLKFNFPDFIYNLKAISKTCGSINSDGVLVRIRFSTTGDGAYPNFYGPLIDNVKFTPNNSNNNVPLEPTIKKPINNASNIPTSVKLEWECSDPDNDPLTYDVYLSKYNPPVTLVSTNQANKFFTKKGLSKNTTYYWQIVTTDNHSNSSKGAVWRFNTGNSTDLEKPVVKLIYPKPSAVVSGNVNIVAQATDNVGIAKVVFEVFEGKYKKIGEDAIPDNNNQYSVLWNTKDFSDGVHNIHATAYDVEGNSIFAGIAVTVKNTGVSILPAAPDNPFTTDYVQNALAYSLLKWRCSDPLIIH